MTSDTTANLIYLGLLGLVFGGWIFAQYRHRLGQALQQALLWMLLFMGVILMYGLKDDLQRQVFPATPAVFDGTKVLLSRAADQHFYVTLQINGTNVDFVIDTGATGMVLAQVDARQIGIDPDNLLYLGVASTANGDVRTARIKLKEVRLGEIVDYNVTAWVNDSDLDFSLLGMSYLSRFSSIEIRGDQLVLTR